jgi:hypothetical protein
VRASQRKAETAWLKKLARDTAREQLRRARLGVRDARAAKRVAQARANEVCRAARVALKEWRTTERARVTAEIARLRRELQSGLEMRRARVRQCCGPDRVKVRAESDARIAGTRAALAAILDARKLERTWSAKGAPSSRRERTAESDHDVEVNLSPDQLPVWHEVKQQIKATPRMSRTEAFLQWMHDHSADVEHILARDAERAYEEAVRDEARHRRMLSSPPHSAAKLRAYVAEAVAPAELAPAPKPRKKAEAKAKAKRPRYAASMSDEAFAAAVRTVAANPSTPGFHDRAYIAGVYDAADWGVSLADFKKRLWDVERKAAAAGKRSPIALTRADLVSAASYDMELLERSEMELMPEITRHLLQR